MRIQIIAICVVLALAGCAPTAEVESTDTGCRARLNRGWLTEQEVQGYRGTCNPDGTVTLEVDAQSQRTQADILEAIARGAAAGARPVP